MGTKYLSATARLVIWCPCDLERGFGWLRWRSDAGKTWSETTAACGAMHKYNRGTTGDCRWIFLHVNLAMVIVAAFYLCLHDTQAKITRRCRRLATSTWSRDAGWGATKSWCVGARSKNVVPAERTASTSASKSCLQTCGEGCSETQLLHVSNTCSGDICHVDLTGRCCDYTVNLTPHTNFICCE